MVSTLDSLLKSSSEIIVVEGEEGIGKTTLLAQFARTYNLQTISAFVTNSSRYAWDPTMLAGNLHEQIQFALGNAPRKDHGEADVQSLLRGSITALQKQANWDKKKYYFVIDGLDEIPKEENGALEQILDLLPTGLPQFRFLLSGSVEIFTRYRKGKASLKSWTLPPFSLDETIKYFSDIKLDRSHNETLYKASAKGIPGRLASIRRLCTANNKTPDEVVSNLSDHAPNLLEKE